MLSLKIPKSVVWVAIVSAFFLLLMSGYRMVTKSIFSPDIAPASYARVLWLGFRFDCRYVALVSLPVMLIGLAPGLHLFKTRSGRAMAIFFFTLFGTLLLLTYGIDLAYQISFNKRLEASILGDLWKGSEQGMLFRQNAPWLTIFLLAGVGSWLIYLFLKLTHHLGSKGKYSANKTMRAFWQILLVLLLVFCIYGRMGRTPLKYSHAGQLGNEKATGVTLNPFQSIWHSITDSGRK